MKEVEKEGYTYLGIVELDKNLNKTGLERKCMDSLSGKCQRMLIRILIKLGNVYPNVI